jgi:hypothetical protein
MARLWKVTSRLLVVRRERLDGRSEISRCYKSPFSEFLNRGAGVRVRRFGLRLIQTTLGV